jgi:hypothetical protein
MRSTVLPVASVSHPATNTTSQMWIGFLISLSMRPYSVFLLPVASLVCLLFAQLGFAQAPNGPVPNTFFAMTFDGGDAPSEFATMPGSFFPNSGNPAIGAMGKESAAEWAYIEPYAPGSAQANSCTMNGATGTKVNPVQGTGVHCYFWSSNGGGLDNYVATASNNNLPFMYVQIPEQPSWANSCGCRSIRLYDGSTGQACGGPVKSENTGDLTDYMVNLVTRYNGKNGHGYVHAYELGNEEDFFECGGSTMSEYATHADTLIKAIKSVSVSPTPLIVGMGWDHPDGHYYSGGDFDNFWSSLKSQDPANAHLDVMSYHGYPHECCTYPEIEAIGNSTYGTGLGSCGTTGYIKCVQAAMSRESVTTFTGGAPTIWDTEGSWGSAPSYDVQQPAFISRFLLLGWSAGASQQQWFSWDGGAQYGQLGGNSSNISAYQQTHNWMVGSTMHSPCSIQSATVWTCGLTEANGASALVVWNTAGASSYSIPAGSYSVYKDLSGNTTTIAGATSVSIGVQPILLEGNGSGAPPPPPANPAPPSGLTATVQ